MAIYKAADIKQIYVLQSTESLNEKSNLLIEMLICQLTFPIFKLG